MKITRYLIEINRSIYRVVQSNQKVISREKKEQNFFIKFFVFEKTEFGNLSILYLNPANSVRNKIIIDGYSTVQK